MQKETSKTTPPTIPSSSVFLLSLSFFIVKHYGKKCIITGERDFEGKVRYDAYYKGRYQFSVSAAAYPPDKLPSPFSRLQGKVEWREEAPDDPNRFDAWKSASLGILERVKYFVEMPDAHGFYHPNSAIKRGNSILFCAAESRNVDLMKYLIEKVIFDLWWFFLFIFF